MGGLMGALAMFRTLIPRCQGNSLQTLLKALTMLRSLLGISAQMPIEAINFFRPSQLLLDHAAEIKEEKRDSI